MHFCPKEVQTQINLGLSPVYNNTRMDRTFWQEWTWKQFLQDTSYVNGGIIQFCECKTNIHGNLPQCYKLIVSKLTRVPGHDICYFMKRLWQDQSGNGYGVVVKALTTGRAGPVILASCVSLGTASMATASHVLKYCTPNAVWLMCRFPPSAHAF